MQEGKRWISLNCVAAEPLGAQQCLSHAAGLQGEPRNELHSEFVAPGNYGFFGVGKHKSHLICVEHQRTVH